MCLAVWVCLPGFVHAYFEYHSHVRLRFKLSAGLGSALGS